MSSDFILKRTRSNPTEYRKSFLLTVVTIVIVLVCLYHLFKDGTALQKANIQGFPPSGSKNNEVDKNTKYLVFGESTKLTGPGGLTHQRSNLKVYLLYARKMGLVPVLPKWRLAGVHVKSKKDFLSNLSEYNDLSSIRIGGEPFRVLYSEDEIPPEAREQKRVIRIPRLQCTLIRKCKPFIGVLDNPLSFEMKQAKHIVALGEQIAKKLGTFTCVHSRRGDRLTLNPSLEQSTTAKNIADTLDRIPNCPKTVYIMTNDNSPNYTQSLRNIPGHTVKLASDFPELKEIEDNYTLFAVEKVIMDRAKTRVSTFNTSPYYASFLDHNFGRQ